MRNVEVARGGRVAVRIDHLDVPAGAVTALVGPNGSGKSTLLHAVAGLLATTGRLEVLGRPPGDARRRVAYVLQTTAVAEHLPMTVGDVVAMGRYAARGPFRRFRPDDRDAVQRALAAVELEGLAGLHLHDLSGGQRQRAVVAQGLAQEADVLLLDEPLAGLDLASAARIQAVVAEQRARGRTVVVATHDLADATAADQVVLLAGRVVAAGPPATALTGATLAAAYGDRLVRLQGGIVVVDDASHHHGT